MNRKYDLVTQLLAFSMLGILLVLLVWPVISVVRAGFTDHEGPTLFYFSSIFQSRIFMEGLLNSFLLAVVSTGLCMLIAIPLAWLMTYHEIPAKRALSSLLLIPLILPPFVGALGMRRLLAPHDGPIVLLARSPFTATALLVALPLYPIMFLNVQAALANIDPAMEEAAQNLGARGGRIFWKITLPLMMPGLFAGSIIIFIWSFTELGTPLMVG
jgi:iron(III) transport system permease protein